MIRIYEKSAKAKAENSWFPSKMAERAGLKASPSVRFEGWGRCVRCYWDTEGEHGMRWYHGAGISYSLMDYKPSSRHSFFSE